MADASDRLARLSPERRLLLQRLLQQEAQAKPDPEEIRPRSGDGPVPLSFAQQRLWFLDRLDPGTPAHNMPFPLRLRGTLDVGVLRRALAGIVRRHEALRTVFAEVEGSPVQVVLPPAPVRLPVVELSALPPEEREAGVLRLAGEEARRPFDLARGPLLRATLVRLDAEDHAVFFTLHHVVSDGWSMGVLVREVSALYQALLRGEPSPLPPLPVQYADYALWQRAWLAGERLERQLGWWRERLAGAPSTLDLPTDRPHRPLAGVSTRTLDFALSRTASHGVREAARREGATTFMVLLASWQLLLGRYSGEEDVVVGTAVANRRRVETEGLIGFFVNTLALRVDLAGDPSFHGVLARVRETTLGAYQHQDLPFERLVEELAPERSVTHTPLFQVMFALQNVDLGALRLGDLRMEPLESGEGVSQFDLDFSLREGPEQFRGALGYRTDLFDAPTVERMLEHFRLLLDAVLHAPERPLSEVSLLSPGERAQLLDAWNATARDYPRGRSLHELVSEQAARTPGAPAVLFEGRALSYAELDRDAGRLARRLRALGVRPEARVAICVERSPEMPVAILAVLRAGGAYVPLDPAYPAERLAWMLEDSGARLVLTQAGLEEKLAGYAGVVVHLGTPHPRPLPHKGGGEHDDHSSAPSRANEFAATTAQSLAFAD